MGRPEELEAEARAVLALLEPLGPLQATGSCVAGLMVSREVEVMMVGGPAYSPADVVTLLARAVEIPGVTGFSYVDERSSHGRFLVELVVDRWTVELSIWLDPEKASAGDPYRELAGRLTAEEREAILAIKRIWRERPEYPGADAVCTAVLEHGVRTAVEFGVWLRTIQNRTASWK
ncbi:hypothetical protein ACTI_09140 [Actinoplanes sp. OR16]|uniref:hypothetical protein n=1 Tax=Actinoplanes sp. OR16 TaxID=946334 RepID=UPI000F6CCB9A|nr:hypothetical protein [Actinoplanes sp. OR16]BBH64229.1 hypothetical protein ACTI_09140 [Actinoplanes sp. OR16]